MKYKLKLLEKHLISLSSSTSRYLREGIDGSSLEKMVSTYFYFHDPLPVQLKELYSWSDGCDEPSPPHSPKEAYIAPLLFFNSIKMAGILAKTEVFYRFIEDKQIPIFQSFNGEFVAFDLANGNLVYCSTWDIEIENKISMYDDLECFLDTINYLYESNCCILDSDGEIAFTDECYENYYNIGARFNPLSEYWKRKLEFSQH